MIRSFGELLLFLEQQRVAHQSKGEGLVAIPTELNAIRGVQLLRWQNEVGSLQFIQSMPLEIGESQVALVESAVVRVNHVLPVPGLDLGPSRQLTYRRVLPFAPDGSVQPREVEGHFRACVRIATSLVPTLRSVLLGELTPTQAAERAPATQASESRPPAPLGDLLRLFQID